MSTALPAFSQNLSDHRWNRRVLVVYAPDKASSAYKNQFKALEGEDTELKERKMIVYAVLGNQVRYTDFVTTQVAPDWQLLDGELAKLIDHQKGFHVWLIGLDGGIKLEQPTVLSKADLFATIDVMPMRMQELKTPDK